MSLLATDKHLAVLVSDLSDTFNFFSNEAVKLKVLFYSCGIRSRGVSGQSPDLAA